MIAIQKDITGWFERWIEYCSVKNIPHKLVDCHKSDIISQLKDCDALMWHFYQASTKDVLFAKQLLYSIQVSGKITFPDFNTVWHFDDKLGQKYLLEAIDAPLVPSYAFYSKEDAIKWAVSASYPKVFKLRGGSHSANVSLVKARKDAVRLINKAFGRGFSQYNAWGSLKERWRKYKDGKMPLREVIEGIFRLIISTDYSKNHGKDRGYIYFQDFIPDNTHDIRVNYVYGRCFASRREVRPGDFRASGSGRVDLDMSRVPDKALKIAFEIASKLSMQTIAFDFVTLEGEPLIVEISYGFGYPEGQFNLGYWDETLTYYPGTFDPFGWMVEGVVQKVQEKHY